MDRVMIQGCLVKYEYLWANNTIIAKDAFKDNHGKKIPVFESMDFPDAGDLIGRAEIENHDDGVYYTLYLNDSDKAHEVFAEILDDMLEWHIGLYANRIRREGGRVLKGNILAGGFDKRVDGSSYIEKIICGDISQNLQGT